MIDLTDCEGTYRRIIEGCMFKLSRKNACLTRFWNRYRYIDTFRRYLTRKQIGFLKDNWNSLDCIEFISRKPFLFQLRDSCVDHMVYQKALVLGFKVYTAEVIFLDEWCYEVELKRFDPGRLS